LKIKALPVFELSGTFY